MATTSFIQSVAGIDWYCETRGEGPWVVLIPSGEGDCAPFEATAALLADRFSVLTFDTPGFSRTSTPADPAQISLPALSGQIAALMASLGIDCATFYGCSSGGRAVLDLVAGNPALVRNGIVHEAALTCPEMDALMNKIAAIPDPMVATVCAEIFADVMNEDAAAWTAQGEVYHARLQRNYLTWVQHYVRAGFGTPVDPARLRGHPIVWTVGTLSDQGAFAGNRDVAAAAGIAMSALACRHFPQVSVPAALAAHIAAATAPHV